MNNVNKVLRNMLININNSNKIVPRPNADPTLPMYTPQSKYSRAMDKITRLRLAEQIDGKEITGYQDACVLTPIGKRQLKILNKDFYEVYNLNK